MITVALILKTEPIGSVFLEPFLKTDNRIRKVVVRLNSSKGGSVHRDNDITTYHSPVSSRKKVKEQAEWLAEILKKENGC